MEKKIMTQPEKLLKDYSLLEKTAYLKAVTALATADRVATEDEQYVLEAIGESAGLTENEIRSIHAAAASETTEAELRRSLDILRDSELRFALITDLVAFAESDQNVTETERAHIKSVADYLGVGPEQYETIHQFVQSAPAGDGSFTPASGSQTFLDAGGMQQQFSNNGMNLGNISKGFLGILLPMVLGKLMGKRGSATGGGGLLDGLLGGGASAGTGGGFGSLISMLNGGGGMGRVGGMLGRMFGR